MYLGYFYCIYVGACIKGHVMADVKIVGKKLGTKLQMLLLTNT